MENTYWSGNGLYQREYEQMMNDLVPASGKCDTVAGEMVRAVSRLGYDFYNNGMGNNTSGAVNYLDSRCVFDEDRTNLFGKIYEYTRGKLPHHDEFEQHINDMIDMTVEYILAHPELETQANTEDMFDYEEPEQNFCEECGDETNYGYMCDSCEEAYYEEEEYA